MTYEKQKRLLTTCALFGCATALILLFFRYLAAPLFPFFIGLVFGVLLQKPLRFLAKATPIPKGIWAPVLVGGFTALVFGLLAYGGWMIYHHLFWLIEQASALVPLLTRRISAVLDQFSQCTQKLPDWMLNYIQTAPAQFTQQAVRFMTDALTRLAANTMKGIPSFLLSTIVTVAAGFFIASDYNDLTAFAVSHAPPWMQRFLCQTKRIFTRHIVGLLRGYTLIWGITFVELFFGFLILNVPYASTLALLVAAVDILPILGTGTILLPWGAVALFLGDTVMGVGILLLYLLITVVRNLMEPKMIGKQVGLPPLVTLAAMYIGLKLFGFFGLWGFPLLLIVGIQLYKANKTSPFPFE